MVLAIIAVLAGLGMGGLSVFRRTVQIEQAKNDLLSALREAQNLARNSVSSSVKGNDILSGKVDGYAIYFDTTTNNFSLRYCIKTTVVNQTKYDCTGVEKSTDKLQSSNEVSVQPANPTKCHGIFFSRLDADIGAITTDLSAIDQVGSCTINLVHTGGGEIRTLIVDLAGNNISAK